MKNITFFFFAFFFLAFFNAANSQSGGQSPVSGLGYAPDSNHVIISKLYRGRNGVAVWMHKDSINWLGGIEYNNHVFLSQNGNNNGKLGRFDKPFADPWTAQGTLNETSLSFLAYQGLYTYSGIGTQNEFVRADTFLWQGLPGSNVEMTNVTGSNLTPFITDRNGASSLPERKTIRINAPNSEFKLTSSSFSIGIGIGTYNPETQVNVRARKLTVETGRRWGVQSAAKNTVVQIDSLSISGQLALSVSEDFTGASSAGTKQRNHYYKVGNVYAGYGNTTDVSGLFRVQTSTVAIDSNSTIIFEVDKASSNTTGFFTVSNNRMYNTYIRGDFGELKSRGTPGTDASMIVLNAAKDSAWQNSVVEINIGYANNSNVFRTGLSSLYPTTTNNLKLTGKSRVHINIKEAVSQGNGGKASIEIENIILRDSAQIFLNCEMCRFEGSKIPIRFTNCDFPAGTKFVISGMYIYNRPGEVVNITTNVDLTGLVFENAVFLNNGVSEWIQASGATTINGASGLWSNSDSTINVTIQANKLWSFQYPGNANFYDLQTVIDSLYNAFSSGSDGNGIISALPAGNVAINAASHNFDITSAGNITQTGSGSATYRFNLYPSSSLPVLLEQTSAGDTAYLQLRASLGRATLRTTQNIYLEAASSVFVSTLEGSSTGIVSARPTGELIRRERAFVNASINTDTFTVALSPTEINLPFNDDVSEGFNVSGDSLIYTGTDTAYFEIGYQQNIEFLESATGTYRLNLSVYQNGVNIPRSEIEHLIYYTTSTTEPILTTGKTFIVQLINGDVLNIRQSGTTGIDTAIHNLSITANKIE